MAVQRTFTGTPWEAKVSYCRAIRRGPFVYVSGTTASDESGNVIGGDAYSQAQFIFEKIERALRELGASLADVVRTRMFVVDISQWEQIGQAHHEAFKDHPPTATMVEVTRLVDERHLVEIEVDAVVLDDPA